MVFTSLPAIKDQAVDHSGPRQGPKFSRHAFLCRIPFAACLLLQGSQNVMMPLGAHQCCPAEVALQGPHLLACVHEGVEQA